MNRAHASKPFLAPPQKPKPLLYTKLGWLQLIQHWFYQKQHVAITHVFFGFDGNTKSCRVFKFSSVSFKFDLVARNFPILLLECSNKLFIFMTHCICVKDISVSFWFHDTSNLCWFREFWVTSMALLLMVEALKFRQTCRGVLHHSRRRRSVVSTMSKALSPRCCKIRSFCYQVILTG